MDRNVRAEVSEDPLTHCFELFWIVVERGDDEGCELDMGAARSGANGGEDVRELGATVFAVEVFVKGFEIDIEGVDVFQQFGEGLGGDVTVSDEDIFAAALADAGGASHDEFEPDGGLVVGVGDAGHGGEGKVCVVIEHAEEGVGSKVRLEIAGGKFF